MHTNSGINNKAAFLMVDGGTFNGQTITGLGITKVAKIYYEVQTHLLTSGADYADLYDALYQGCNNLVGTCRHHAADCQEVRNATIAVEMNLQPVAGFNPEAPVCAVGQTPANVFFDNLESGTGQLARSAASAGTQPLELRLALWAVRALRHCTSCTRTTIPASSPTRRRDDHQRRCCPPNAYLHFAHAYGFEDAEPTTAASWNTAPTAARRGPTPGQLFDANGYTGTIDSGLRQSARRPSRRSSPTATGTSPAA